jgi:hypothetical protein
MNMKVYYIQAQKPGLDVWITASFTTNKAEVTRLWEQVDAMEATRGCVWRVKIGRLTEDKP